MFKSSSTAVVMNNRTSTAMATSPTIVAGLSTDTGPPTHHLEHNLPNRQPCPWFDRDLPGFRLRRVPLQSKPCPSSSAARSRKSQQFSRMNSQQFHLRQVLRQGVDVLGKRVAQFGLAGHLLAVAFDRQRVVAERGQQSVEERTAVTGAVQQWQQMAVQRR